MPKPRTARAPRRSPRLPRQLGGIVAQVRTAARPEHRLAAGLGAALGGFVPAASYVVAHHEIDPTRPLYAQPSTYFVCGGLAFSALTVFGWGRLAFASRVKALGWTLLLEGVMVAAHTPWLAAVALAYLVAANAVATGCRLALGEPRPPA